MLHYIKKVFDWNTIANYGNKPIYNRHLEVSMLTEEFAEFVQALKDNNRTEILDACSDIMFVLFGTMQKNDFTPQQIVHAFNEVIKSNYSKFQKWNNEFGYEVYKDVSWKIIKPFTFEAPKLEGIANGTEKFPEELMDNNIDFSSITRFEAIDNSGRGVVYHNVKIAPSVQDGGKTLKIFIKK